MYLLALYTLYYKFFKESYLKVIYESCRCQFCYDGSKSLIKKTWTYVASITLVYENMVL